jgi:hypothetical protein
MGLKGNRKYTVVFVEKEGENTCSPSVMLMLTVLPHPVPHHRPDE